MAADAGMDEVARLVGELVALDSINPTLVPGAAGERRIGLFVADWLEQRGLEPRVEWLGDRPLVLATRRGSGNGPVLLLNAHTDTVAAGGMAAPHVPHIDGDRLFGRGAYDMKGGLAAAMLALAELPPLAGDVVLAAVPDEEAGGMGTRHLLTMGLRFDAAVIPEPTDERIAVAHRGYVGFKLTTRGLAAHGSRPDQGVDAIARMGPVLTALAELDRRVQASTPHPVLGSGNVHAGTIRGGTEPSTYPAECVLEGEWRTVPADRPRADLEDLADRTGADLTVDHVGEPFETPAGARVLRLLEDITGAPRVTMPYWTDAALLAGAGIPTVLFGPAGHGPHADDEHVSLPSVQRVRHALRALACAFCG